MSRLLTPAGAERRALLSGLGALALGSLVPAGPAAAVDARAKARAYFTDTPLTTHDGRGVRFYTDLLAGKTVAINFFYTRCQDACPLISATLAGVQKELGERMGRDIFFVSITTDPDNDDVTTLASYSEQFDAGPGWTFVTGAPESLSAVSAKLGQLYEREQHLTVLLAGNVDAEHWKKIQANTPEKAIALQLSDLADGVVTPR